MFNNLTTSSFRTFYDHNFLMALTLVSQIVLALKYLFTIYNIVTCKKQNPIFK